MKQSLGLENAQTQAILFFFFRICVPFIDGITETNNAQIAEMQK